LPGLTVVLTCFNEAATIAQRIHEARWAAVWNADEYQIVVVDDGSTDGSAQIAADVAHEVAHVRVVEHGENRGFGAARVSGLRVASLPWVLLTDADLPFDLDQLERFVSLSAGADLVVDVDSAFELVRREVVDLPLMSSRAMISTELVVRPAPTGARVREVGMAYRRATASPIAPRAA
jgi:glycosyltransferase involved in cell wall biosynthesis